MKRTKIQVLLTLAALSIGACDDAASATEPADPRLADELDIGDSNEPGVGKDDGFSHNGEDDFSEVCKAIPNLEPLVDPVITISIDGRTVHLRDRGSDYDVVFPVGLGKIRADGTSRTPTSDGASEGVFFARGDEVQIVDAPSADKRKWAWNYSCRHWSGTKYFNPATGQKEFRSYFAGLPFIRFEGPERAVYGLHGPIDNYWRENGGELYRGYVSGGCSRMDPDDLVELAARIAGHETPVLIQQEIEFDDDGLSIDSDRFMGAHCLKDSDCADDGATCVAAAAGDFKFCTMPCEANTQCPVRENDIVGSSGVASFCVEDTNDLVSSSGLCVVEGNAKTNNSCRSYPASLSRRKLALIDDPGTTPSVCAP